MKLVSILYINGKFVKKQNPFRDFDKFGHLSCVILLLPFVEVNIRVYVPEIFFYL